MVYYAVHKGKIPGVFTNWESCNESIKGFSAPIFKKFKDIQKAKHFAKTGEVLEVNGLDSFFGVPTEQKEIKNNDVKIKVYTDGDLIRMEGNTYAGYGVWFGVEDDRNACIASKDRATTVNQMELKAIFKAIERVQDDLDDGAELTIYTDSQYCIQVLGATGKKYQKNNFKNNKGAFVPNHKLIKKGLKILENRRVKFVKVKSHTNAGDEIAVGNDAADRLAMYGTLVSYFGDNPIDVVCMDIPKGKYKGKSIKWLYKNNPRYANEMILDNDLCIKHGLFFRCLVYYVDQKEEHPLFMQFLYEEE